MTDDPYRLARDIRGIGFRSADVIAMRLALTKESPKRLRAVVSYALQTATDEGHCALPVESLTRDDHDGRSPTIVNKIFWTYKGMMR